MPGSDDGVGGGVNAFGDLGNEPAAAAPANNKPKRVRTGCLTCRERHLKCDEAQPICQNCRKSNRTCRRGVRLNFIDTTVKQPPVIPISPDWAVNFLDESREIASEYVGGLGKYSTLESRQSSTSSSYQQQLDRSATLDYTNFTPPPAPQVSHQALPTMPTMMPDPYAEDEVALQNGQVSTAFSASSLPDATASVYSATDQDSSPQDQPKDYLDSQEEVLFMQVFVEEVGLWMDSLNPNKHFSRLLPFHALSEPMLLNAFLACGARHLALVNPKYSEDKALHYYDTATRYLLNSLQNPNRDTVICATTAVILNVYEIMCERALQRMNHIAGARALIKECGWNARSTGIGSACFWLNIGMELLSCLHFNWQVAWDPDEWGVDMNFSREEQQDRDDIWTHRIIYIVAKIANFRASTPSNNADQSPESAQMRFNNRYNEWKRLKSWCDSWNDNIPRTMHPMAYLYPDQTTSQSAFPEVWLIKRTTIVARLFYHTAMVLMSQINPAMSVESEEMHTIQRQHSQLTCGIVAHVKDRGVASVAIRSLAIAAECLTDRREQEEVLQIFDKIRQETGWNVAFVHKELPEKWGWNRTTPQMPQQESPYQQAQQTTQPLMTIQQPLLLQPQPQPTATTSMPQSRIPAGILNPLLAAADFSMPQHPYQSYYVPPSFQFS